ncbi:hypothetical protein JCM30394_05460 [Deferrisoma palaeochoriense]
MTTPGATESFMPGRGLLALSAVLTGIAFAVALTPVATAPEGEAFQRAAGGLGLGAAVAPRWSFHSFDLRLAPVDETLCAPLPGRIFPNPDAASVVGLFPEVWR